jgi:hypothetical protein
MTMKKKDVLVIWGCDNEMMWPDERGIGKDVLFGRANTKRVSVNFYNNASVVETIE